MGRLSGRCKEAFWRVWEGYLEGVGKLSVVLQRLSARCGKDV